MAGAFGALVGVAVGYLAVLAANIALKFTNLVVGNQAFTEVLLTSVFIATIFGCVCVAMLLAAKRFQRQIVRPSSLLGAGGKGALAGAISGGLVQAVFNGVQTTHEYPSVVANVIACVIAGTLVGALLSQPVPNYPPQQGLVSGLIASIGASVLFAFVGMVSPGRSALAATAGYLLFGALLGLVMAITERRPSSPSIDVEWSSQEVINFRLGEKPITVGGDANDVVFIRGAPPRVSSIAISNGTIEHVETSTGNRTALKNGSRLRIGGLVMVVHADH